jgi:citrate synthase
MDIWLTSEEAIKKLGVTRATLYAYVSRGLIHSMPSPGDPHARRYAREDVERIQQRTEQRRDPQKAVDRALHWGMPLLESSITLIAGGHLYYRGQDACELATTRSVEEIASYIWLGSFERRFDAGATQIRPTARTGRLPFIARAQSILPVAAADDLQALDLRPIAVAETGWRILNLLVSHAVDFPETALAIDERLRRAWAPRIPNAGAIIRAALILSADHELNVSSFTARCVASAGANPYMAVLGGLAALEGPKHGGTTRQIAGMLNEIRGELNPARAIADRLRRGEPMYGFHHPLYANGDPRAMLILELLQTSLPKSTELALSIKVVRAVREILDQKPTLDFALVALAQAMRLPADAALTLFALGRTIGWIGHAIEQYASGELIRPRAKYAGMLP